MRTLLRVALLLFCFCNFCGTTVVCAEEQELEQKIKVAFLLNFAKFATWPDSFWPADRGQFLLDILGEDPFGMALGGVEEKLIGNKPVRVRYDGALTDELLQSQLVFVSRSVVAELPTVIGFLGKAPIITVSDIDGFAAAGGIIEFKRQEGRLSFIINNSKARQNGIHINSSLLKLAIEVL